MTRAVWLAFCLTVVVVPAAAAVEEAPRPREKKPKEAKVEFRWLEGKHIKGLTEEKGFRNSCGDELVYAHLKPILTNKDVVGTRMTSQSFPTNGLPTDYFFIEFLLTQEARQSLVAACGDKEAKTLAVFVDGRYWGTSYFRKADFARFAPHAGFFTSKDEAERIVASCQSPAPAK